MSDSLPSGLYDRPVLVLDPGMHTAPIIRAGIDAAGRTAVTGSLDKTIRVWDVETGHHRRTIRLPQGPGDLGKVYALAISPDGALVAAGGWLGATKQQSFEQIYIFDVCSGNLVKRISNLPATVVHLTFSQDGNYLAATCRFGLGVFILSSAANWCPVISLNGYSGDSYGAAFAPDGRLSTTCYDDIVRLYAPNFQIINAIRLGEDRPFGVAFSKNGDYLAVGFHDSLRICLHDGNTLVPIPSPSVEGIEGGNLMTVGWSSDGELLLAGGMCASQFGQAVVSWGKHGFGARGIRFAGHNSIMGLTRISHKGGCIGAQDR